MEKGLAAECAGHHLLHHAMLKIPVHIPELNQLPVEKREPVLKACLESGEFVRRVWRSRIVSFIVYLVLLIGPPWLVRGPLAKDETQGYIYTALAILGIIAVVFVVPFYTEPRILRRLIRERLRDANKEPTGKIPPDVSRS